MITNGLVVLAFALSLIFPLSYARSKWSMYPPGRALMFFSVIVAIVLGLATWRSITGDPAPMWMRLVSYGGIIIALAYMDFVLLQEQSKDRKRARLVSSGRITEDQL